MSDPRTEISDWMTREKINLFFDGAHSTGKTTLSKAVEQRYDIQRVEEPVRSILAQNGTTARMEGCDPKKVLMIQDQIMLSHLDSIGRREDRGLYPTVFDRTPFAVYAYSLIHVGRLSDAQATLSWQESICKSFAKRRLDTPRKQIVFITAPDGVPLEDDGVREVFPQHRQHVHYLLLGLLREMGADHHVLCNDSLDARLREVESVLLFQMER